MKVINCSSIDNFNPEDNLLHIVVFGPGTGEAIVVVFPTVPGHDVPRIGVVDGAPGGVVSRWIGKQLNGQRLLFACLTHPHADHYAGFAKLVTDHPPEHLWWAGDEENRFFEAWAMRCAVQVERPGPETKASQLEKLRMVLDDSLRNKRSETRHRTLADRKRLLAHGPVEVDGLLPTTAEKHDKIVEMVECKDKKSRNGEFVNDLSGAITIRWGDTRVLLGGDCNAGSEEDHCGWKGHGEALKKFTLVKVPHHGSDKSYRNEAAKEMAESIGIVTPFHLTTDSQPPTADQLQWWCRHLTRLFITTPKEKLSKLNGNDLTFHKTKARSDPESAIVASLDDLGNVIRIYLFGKAQEVLPLRG